jgi:DNA polymerase (family 10)
MVGPWSCTFELAGETEETVVRSLSLSAMTKIRLVVRGHVESIYDRAMTTTKDVLAMLSELVTLTALAEGSKQSFKVRAYENAGLGLESDGRDITTLSLTELVAIDGVGKATASKVLELVETGKVEKLETLRAEFPPEFVELSRIPGLGPKTLMLVRSQLGIENVEQLRQAISDEQLRHLPGLGATSEAKISKAIERLGMTGKDRRTPIADALPLAERLVDDLRTLTETVDAQLCGSLRRMSETIGDIDITVSSDDPAAVMAFVVGHNEVSDLVVSGATKTSFLTAQGLQVDVRVVAPDQFGAATLYFTGSKAHNITLRQRAIDKQMLLNEYGLMDASNEDIEPAHRPVIASRTETEIYAALGMEFVPAPMRESTGEVEAAGGGGLPRLVQRSDIKGDLHYHTDRSGDGRSTVAEMAAVAAAQGYEYLAITDHGVDLSINGSTAEEMLEHRERIAEVALDHADMTILWGCELNIGPDGGLDYDDDFRALFDYTVASVHSHFDQTVAKQTDRLVAAIADPTVNSIGHLTGRYIGRRPGIEIDYDAVIDALVEFDVALEINGALQRLDAASDVVRKAVDKKVKLVINTDSHHTSELGRMEYGVLTAQRGWVPRDLVINTWDRDTFLTWSQHRAQ